MSFSLSHPTSLITVFGMHLSHIEGNKVRFLNSTCLQEVYSISTERKSINFKYLTPVTEWHDERYNATKDHWKGDVVAA